MTDIENREQPESLNTEEMPEFQAQKSFEEQCREFMCPTCPQKTDAEDARLRALAEMENFKKRLQRDHDERMRYAAEPVFADMIPALDSLDLAIQYGSAEEGCTNMLTGVSMTRKLLLDSLKPHGFVPVGAEGEPFDPDIHEAVAHEERDDMEEGLVSSLKQRGYKLKDRLLRPAKVAVSKRPA